MHILVIGNPVAGRGRTLDRIHQFVKIVETRGHHVETFLTDKAGDGAERAGVIGPGVDRLVIAGGDGTVNEVLNGLQDPSIVPILHLPTGTANQLAYHLGLPTRPELLAEVVAEGTIKRIDMGIVNGHRFLLQVSAGFDASVTEVIHHHRKKRLGYRGYVLPLIMALANPPSTDVEVLVDGKIRLVGSTVMAMKVRHYGRVFVFADGAKLDSGHFDVCVFRGRSIPATCLYMLAGLARQADRVPGITLVTGSRIRMESAEPVAVQVDGTYFGTTPVDLELLPAHVPVVVPSLW